jgi:ribonuclease D
LPSLQKDVTSLKSTFKFQLTRFYRTRNRHYQAPKPKFSPFKAFWEACLKAITFWKQPTLKPTMEGNPRVGMLPKPIQPPFPEMLDKEVLADLPLVSYPGPIYVIQNPAEVGVAVKLLLKEEVLGFDTETRPVFRRGEYYPVALLQLTGKSATYIFQLSCIERQLKPLAKILSSSSILKAGVAVKDDVKKLQERIHFQPKGFVEVSDLSRGLGIQQTGLRNLAGILLGVRISKAAQVSNWALRCLTRSQVQYAATDSWISRALYERCVELQKLLKIKDKCND